MMQVYVANIKDEAREDDLRHFFRKYGKIRDVSLKQGYAFVVFENEKDGDDAIHDLNGEKLLGLTLRIEKAHGRGPRGPNRFERGSSYYGGGGGRYDDHYGPRGGYYDERRGYRDDDYHGRRGRGNYSEPRQTRYRLIVENLSTHCSWQNLKDMMRDYGEVTFADAHKGEKNVGFVCFETHSGLRKAMEKFQGKEINGRALKLTDGTPRSRSRSPSPKHRSPTAAGTKRSRERSYSPASRSRSSSSISRRSSSRGSRSTRSGGDKRKK